MNDFFSDPFFKLYRLDTGTPTGACTEQKHGVFLREWSGGRASSPFAAHGCLVLSCPHFDLITPPSVCWHCLHAGCAVPFAHGLRGTFTDLLPYHTIYTTPCHTRVTRKRLWLIQELCWHVSHRPASTARLRRAPSTLGCCPSSKSNHVRRQKGQRDLARSIYLIHTTSMAQYSGLDVGQKAALVAVRPTRHMHAHATHTTHTDMECPRRTYALKAMHSYLFRSRKNRTELN